MKVPPDDRDRAAVPVVGTILLVALTILLASTVGLITLGIGEDVDAEPPTTAFETDVTTDRVVFIHHSGENIDGDRITVTGGDILSKPTTLEAGGRIEVDPRTRDEPVKLVYEAEQDDTSQILAMVVADETTDDKPSKAANVPLLRTEAGEPLVVGETYNTTADSAESPVILVPATADDTWTIDMTTDLSWDPAATQKDPGERATIPDWFFGFAVPAEGEIAGVTVNETTNEFVVDVVTCSTDC